MHRHKRLWVCKEDELGEKVGEKGLFAVARKARKVIRTAEEGLGPDPFSSHQERCCIVREALSRRACESTPCHKLSRLLCVDCRRQQHTTAHGGEDGAT